MNLIFTTHKSMKTYGQFLIASCPHSHSLYMESIAAGALRETKHEVHSQDVNKAWAKAKCFIGIMAACWVLYYM